MAEGFLKINSISVYPEHPLRGGTVTVTAHCENTGVADIVNGAITLWEAPDYPSLFNHCYTGATQDCIDLPGSGSSDRFWNFDGSNFVMPSSGIVTVKVNTSHRIAYFIWIPDDFKELTITSPDVDNPFTLKVNDKNTNFSVANGTNLVCKTNGVVGRTVKYYDVRPLIDVQLGTDQVADSSGNTEISATVVNDSVMEIQATETISLISKRQSNKVTVTVGHPSESDISCVWYDIICKIKTWFGDYWIWILLIIITIILLLVYLIMR